jgi:hypothetical protein
LRYIVVEKVDGIFHPRSSSLDFGATAPRGMVGVNRIAYCRYAVLAVKHGPLNLLGVVLPGLNLKT